MSTVIAAIYGAGLPQSDGRVYVVEVFILDTGEVRQSTYLADPSTDMAAHLAEMQTNLEAALNAPDE